VEKVECVVIGAGVVGLAVARRLAAAGREVIVLEAERSIGMGTSSRNSEVIHAGIYYPTGSLRARLCVAGKERLYAYLDERGLPHARVGKLIVAGRPEETGYLERLMATGLANDVDDLRMIDGEEAQALEPELSCYSALISPSTGILDTHAYMLSLQGDAEAAGAAFAFAAPVTGGAVGHDGIRLEVGGADPMTLSARHVVNAAGLTAHTIAASLAGFPAAHVPRVRYSRGVYFSLTGKTPFGRLIYPVPDGAWLGVHFTLDMAGRGKLGPDVEWIDSLDYRVDPARAAAFAEAVGRYWPAVRADQLVPDYAGVRPRLVGPGEAPVDFLISGPRDHGVLGLVNLFGIESPGLTSSLALADHVATQLGISGISSASRRQLETAS
jgi:L-2-hydroxyglutarate oxidase LhgO